MNFDELKAIGDRALAEIMYLDEIARQADDDDETNRADNLREAAGVMRQMRTMLYQQHRAASMKDSAAARSESYGLSSLEVAMARQEAIRAGLFGAKKKTPLHKMVLTSSDGITWEPSEYTDAAPTDLADPLYQDIRDNAEHAGRALLRLSNALNATAGREENKADQCGD